MSKASRVVLRTGVGLLGTGRFLFGCKRDRSGRLAGEEWWAVLFVPLVPRRSLSLITESVDEDRTVALVETSAPLSRSEIASRSALSLAGIVSVVLTLALIDASSSNTGLPGGLLVVCSGGLLTAVAGSLDWLRPRIEEGDFDGARPAAVPIDSATSTPSWESREPDRSG